jgi:SAM-dependent methyltransferase
VQVILLSATSQQQFYEAAYNDSAAAIGFPDPNLSDGAPPSHRSILTVGGGTASDLWQFAANNTIVNVEYAASGLKTCKRFGVHGVLTNLNLSPNFPFSSQSFDLIVCKDILEHLLDPLAVLADAARVLRDDGTIVISVPNHFYWPMRLRLLFGKGILWRGLLSDHGAAYKEWDYMHIRFFTYKGFCAFIAAAGLTPVKLYWDFGNLAYYYNPDRWFAPQLQKRESGCPLSRRAIFGLYVLRPLWRAFNVIFPKALRSAIVSLAPGFFCAGFYAHCRKA